MAEAAVRAAVPDDVAHIARIQRETWRLAYADLLPATVFEEWDDDAAARSWTHALQTGPARLFVATEGVATVGFCAAGPAPAEDLAGPDGQLPPDANTVVLVAALLVEPRWGRRGHGGRLLATACAALRAQGAERGVTWVPEADDVSRAFYASAGWQPDGVARTLDTGGRPLREIRLSGTTGLTLVFR
jgi:GNAT superfamily N-acetyltransferase